ncbi:MAG: hypothetical protein ACKVT0_11910 [Planctomycetaceae bacterium]
MKVPTESDWRTEPWCLDTESAYEHFFGLTVEQATQLFEENALNYSEDLYYMPAEVFTYYLPAFVSYLLSEKSRGDSDGASCFISLIEFRAEYTPSDIRSNWHVIEPVLRKLSLDQEYYDADWEFYGCFRVRIHEIVKRGFNVTIDTSSPEKVPAGVTVNHVRNSNRTYPIIIAQQIFSNSGIGPVSDQTTKTDLIQLFGKPYDEGGRILSKFGRIPHWIRFKTREGLLRFELVNERVSTVTFMPSIP